MKKMMTTLVVVLIIGFGGIIISPQNAAANAIPDQLNTKLPVKPDQCQQLWNNCVATAINDYANGTDDFATFYMFYEYICPGAYGDCMGMN